MSPLSPEQTQESIQRFEQQAGLRDAGYTPHKGLTAEETKYLRGAEALHVSSWLRDFGKCAALAAGGWKCGSECGER